MAQRTLFGTDGVRGIANVEPMTSETALRLGRYFHMSPQFLLGLQMDYDLDVTADSLANRLNREVKPHALAA